MPHRFCAICGKDINDSAPHFGMCINCYLKEKPLFELPERLSFKLCLGCGAFSKKDEWLKSEENEILKIIESGAFNFLLKQHLKKKNIDFKITIDENSLIYSSKGLIKSVDLNVKGTLKENINIMNQQMVNLKLNYELCQNCLNLKGGTYFLSIIQFRVKEEEQFTFLTKVIDEIQNYVENVFEKDQRQYITKIEDQKYGVDLYLSTNELMNHIISFLKGNYYFILKRSKKLVGRDSQKGKNLYRLKSLIKFLPITKNDKILIDNTEYIVENITKNKILLRDENGTKLIRNYSYFFNDKFSIKNKGEED